MALSDSEYLQLSDEGFYKALYSFAWSIAKKHETAEDLAQQTILKILENQDKFETGTNLRAWAFTILRNTYYSHTRKSKREITTSGDFENEDDQLAAALINQQTEGNQLVHLELNETLVALDHLPAEQRTAIELIGMEQLDYKQAAKEIGVAVGTIKSRINRAKLRLAEILDDPAALKIDLSAERQGRATLSQKAGLLVTGYVTAPPPQKLNQPVANIPRTKAVRRPSKPTVPKTRKEPKSGKALKSVIEELGIKEPAIQSAEFMQILDKITTQAPRQKIAVIEILKGKTGKQIADEQGTQPANIYQAVKTVRQKLEAIAKNPALLKDNKSKAKPKRRKPKPYYKTLRQTFAEAGIKGHPLKSEQAQDKYSQQHYNLRRVLIKQGVKGNPLLSEKFQQLASNRLTAIQKDTVQQIISGHSLDDIARDYQVQKITIINRLNAAIEKLAYIPQVQHKRSRPQPNAAGAIMPNTGFE